MRISVDRDKCVGAGQCVSVAPHIFDQDEDDGIVVVLDATPPDALRKQADEAAFLCPAQVIIVE